MFRTNTCGELTDKDKDKKVKICGWVSTRRDHGGIIFIDLRDRYGLTQIVLDPKKIKESDLLKREFVIQVEGQVKIRPKGTENLKLTTGKVEVHVSELNIINKADIPPIDIDDNLIASEELRLKYRYLDLRRPSMQQHLIFRNEVAKAAREYLDKNKFIEIETPILVKSTPEGARDYVVPSRVNKGQFYALPQSPQLYKQILMVAGFDRYFQLARCLRDEDLRQDRQPEHTQIDMEMSFVTSNEIRDMVEGLMKHLFNKTKGMKLEKFPVLTYKESMDKYGNDKPDLRFGLELIDFTQLLKNSDFNVFKDVAAHNGIIKGLAIEREFTRTELDDLTKLVQSHGAKGLAYVKISKDKLDTGISKFLKKEEKEIIKKSGIKEGTLFFTADQYKKANNYLAILRNELGKNLIKKDEFKFCWVIDFPLFAWNEEESKWEPEHHMFSMPNQQFVKDLEKDPGKVTGDLFDLVMNGTEMGSGSIRISNPELQERIMKMIGMDKKEAYAKFGFLLEAYHYGGPVHGGMGIGLDRLTALMQGFNDIREVIAFPKNKAAECPMDSCPSPIDAKQLKELNIKLA